MITTAGWNAFLKILEEPPMYTIFMFCTTDAQKIPATIQNRLMKFNLSKISTEQIKSRLLYICEQEGFINFAESAEYIAKLADGGMRDAIAMLEKCSNYSTDLSIDNVLQSLGNFSHQTMFDLTNALIDGKEKDVFTIVDSVHDSGNDLKLFIDSYLDFALDLNKFCLFGSMDIIKIPSSKENDIKYTTSISGNVTYFNKLVNRLLEIKNSIKNDSSIKNTITILLINICRGV